MAPSTSARFGKGKVVAAVKSTMRGVDRLLLRIGAVMCGVLLFLGLIVAPDWPRHLIATGAGLAGLVFFAWVIRRLRRRR